MLVYPKSMNNDRQQRDRLLARQVRKSARLNGNADRANR